MVSMVLRCLMILPFAAAHIAIVCTATSPSVPGQVFVLLGTYHDRTDPTNGIIQLYPPGSSVSTDLPMEASCSIPSTLPDANNVVTALMTTSGANPCNQSDVAYPIKTDSVISCYGPESAASSVEGTLDNPFPVVPVRRPDDAWQYQRTRELTMFTYASFTASSGTHKLTVTDNTAGLIYGACTEAAGTPCMVGRDLGGESAHLSMTFSVADGGTACNSELVPFVP